MKYLHLRFENACLKHADAPKTKDGNLGDCSLKDIEGTNWSCPIGLDQVSNMLHVMFGLAPKATNRDTIFKRNKELYDIAKNSYIKYDNYSKEDIESAKYASNLEFFQTGKPAFNSHSKVSTTIDGQAIQGHYTWNYFERRFKGKEDQFKFVMDFFNDVLEVRDVRKYYYFPEFVEEFHKHLKEKKVKDFFKDYLYEGSELFGGKIKRQGSPFNKPLVNLLKNAYSVSDGTNCSYSQATPLLYSHGTGRKFSLSGEIIVPLEDEHIKFLEEYGTLPTLLDGGLVSVVSVRKKPPYIGFENDFILLSKAKKWRN